MAWEGAFGVAPKEVDGTVMSGAFVVYEIDRESLDPQFIDYYFKIRSVWEKIGASSTGTNVRRRSLHPDVFEKAQIPLPPLSEQRRIVAKIERLSAKVEEANNLRAESIRKTQHLISSTVATVFPKPKDTVLGDFIMVQSGYAFKSEWFTEDGVRLVRNVNIGHGNIEWMQVAKIPWEQRIRFQRFELALGDILVSLDRPIISTGIKVARVREEDLPSLLLQRVGRFCYKDDTLVPGYLFKWLQSAHFIDAIDPGRSNGVPHISQKDIEKIPFTPLSKKEQRNIVSFLDELQTDLDRLKRLQAKTAAELNVMLPSILDRAFKGEL